MTLDRLYNRKLQRTQFERSASWAPHHRARREVHGIYECFDGDLDGAPVKELKKVLTPSVLQKDQEAISAITKRLQNEETFKVAWKAMEQYRRQDTLQDFKRRQIYNDMLEQMAGQPCRRRDPHHILPNNCSKRTEELSKPKQPYVIEDITRMTDYRGLVHADSQLALEALFPGAGHEESLRIKEENTMQSRAGTLNDEQREDQENRTLSKSRAKSDSSLLNRLSKNSVPTSQHRLDKIAQRTNDEVYARFAKEQYCPTEAPPAPNQKDTLLKEDWSPATTKADPKRITGNFTRSAQGTWGPGAAKSQESIPPPTRPAVYPMLTPMAERTRKDTADRLIASSYGEAVRQDDGQDLDLNQSKVGVFEVDSPMSSTMSSPRRTRRFRTDTAGSTTLSKGYVERDPTTAALCAELDHFEATITPAGPLGSFTALPHCTGSSWWQSEQQRKLPVPPEPEDQDRGFGPSIMQRIEEPYQEELYDTIKSM